MFEVFIIAVLIITYILGYVHGKYFTRREA